MQKTLGGRPSPPAGPIAAAGTLPRSQAVAAPSRARRVQLALEILVVFVGGPLAMTSAIYVARTPLFAALGVFDLIGAAVLIVFMGRLTAPLPLAEPVR